MPDPTRSNFSIHSEIVEKAKKRYLSDKNSKSFTDWISNYVSMNLDRDKLMKDLFPNLEFVGIRNNSIFICNTINDDLISAKIIEKKLKLSTDNSDYGIFISSLPELGRIKFK